MAGQRRGRGQGRLLIRPMTNGEGVWYGKFWVDGRQQQHRIGLQRKPGSKEGLTRPQAEAKLRSLMLDATSRPAEYQRMTVENAGERYIADVVERLRDRKPSTVAGYKAILEKHLAVFFRGVAIDRVDEAMVEQYMTAKRGRPANLTAATVTRHVILLGGITRYAVRKGWAMRNPVANVEKPISSRSDEIRFLDVEQVEVLLRAAPTDDDLDNARRCIVRGVC